MTKLFPIALAVALVAVSCSQDVSRIQTRTLPSPNPTSYTFPLPVEEVHMKALQAFSTERQMKEPIFGRAPGTVHSTSTLSVECSTNAIFGKAVLDKPANANDIFLHSFHTPFATSSVYRGRNGGLPFIASFHLHLSGSGSDTLATVTASDAEVINGTKFSFGPCGPGQVWNCVRVKPTTVEEYSILRYLGGYLGMTNMPEIILPTQ